MNGLLDLLSDLIGKSGALAPLLALAAGVVASFLPCSLSTVPLIVGFVGGTGQRDPKKAFLLSLVFAAGSAVTFTALGAAASVAGRLVGASSSWWYVVLGVLMVLMALQMWEVFEFIPASYLVSKSARRGFFGAFLAGILSGVFSSPCSTPVLIVLLAAVAGRGNVAWGVLLLLCYSAGHGMLAVLAGTSVGFVQKLSKSGGYGVWSRALRIAMGCLILLLGFYMLYLGF